MAPLIDTYSVVSVPRPEQNGQHFAEGIFKCKIMGCKYLPMQHLSDLKREIYPYNGNSLDGLAYWWFSCEATPSLMHWSYRSLALSISRMKSWHNFSKLPEMQQLGAALHFRSFIRNEEKYNKHYLSIEQYLYPSYNTYNTHIKYRRSIKRQPIWCIWCFQSSFTYLWYLFITNLDFFLSLSKAVRNLTRHYKDIDKMAQMITGNLQGIIMKLR